MEPLGNDRFQATFVPDELGRWQYQVVGWLDHLGTWRHGMELKLAAGRRRHRRPADRRRPCSTPPPSGPSWRRPTPPPWPTCRRRLEAGDTRLLGRLPSEDEPRHARRPHPRPRGRRAGAAGRHRRHRPRRAVLAGRDPRAGRRAGPPDRRRGRPRAGPVQRLVRVLPPLDAGPGRRATARCSTPSTGSTTSPSMGFDVLYLPPVHPIGTTQRKGRNNTDHAGRRRHRQPVGDRRARGRAHRRPPRARHGRRRHQDRRRPAASGASSWRSTSRSSARPTTRGSPSTRRGSPTGPTARSSTPRTRRRSTRTSTRSTSRAPTGRRLWTDAGRRHPVLDRRRRHDLPRRQPAHQGVRVLGVGDRHDPPRAPRDDLPRRGVHPAPGDGAAGQDRLQPVVHVLHVAPVVVGAAQYFEDLADAHRRLLPAQRLAEHARHPHRAAADRRPGDVRQPGRPGRHAVAGVGRLRPGVRAAGAPAGAGRLRGVPRLGEVPAAPVGPAPARQPRPAARPAQPHPPRAAGAAPTCAR